ncbi:hypothetical protein [Bradyrhizobium sp.]|uniref:hypothetical protein n=1 Tax=Bradyrhizobium sp. TaxID=376 RepID=UPI002E0BADD4|nr:hypothetical protein [Bradyrhizobium sp.]
MRMAAYALTRLILFGSGWGVATVLALAADAQLPGVKWPILGISAALWTFIYGLYVAGEANRSGAASSTSPLPWGEVELRSNSGEGLIPNERA